MSDPFSDELDGLEFDERTTKDSFNERLLKAREDSEHELEPHLVRQSDSPDSTPYLLFYPIMARRNSTTFLIVTILMH